jgi:hypothetical protein
MPKLALEALGFTPTTETAPDTSIGVFRDVTLLDANWTTYREPCAYCGQDAIARVRYTSNDSGRTFEKRICAAHQQGWTWQPHTNLRRGGKR